MTKERPILFSAAMVLATLEGRKTQTRMVIKPQPKSKNTDAYPDRYNHGPEWAFWLPDNRMTEEQTWKCPYGEPGDRLWVRETWIHGGFERGGDMLTLYRADGDHELVKRWKPSISMPRCLSRIMLEITGVRVERVQEITHDGALAEGIQKRDLQVGNKFNLVTHYVAFPEKDGGLHSAVAAFEMLWDSANAKRGFGWDENPWVWVVEFRKCEPSTK